MQRVRRHRTASCGCDIYETGDGGISLDGGDRVTLTPADAGAENNHIHHYSRWNRVYQPGIAVCAAWATWWPTT